MKNIFAMIIYIIEIIFIYYLFIFEVSWLP